MRGKPAARAVISAASRTGVTLDEEQAERLVAFAMLVEERAVGMGLVARSDAGRVLERHVLDSLRAVPFVSDARDAYDLGAGAGLPGIVVAVAQPRCRVTLVESNGRKAGFLELVVERLGITNAEVAARRAESLTEAADAATARALAPLEASWKIAVPLLRPGGRLIYFAGGSLEHPERAASALDDPERPARVELARGLATRPPLVIMTRG